MPDLPLAARIHQYLATLAPHMREREAAMLLAEAKDELATLRAEIDRLRWIPVTERLPERNEIVLATDQDGVTVGSYSPMLDDWWTLHGDRMAPGAIVAHWMPLPKPPDAT